jgi:hypothetical protein
MTRRIFRGLKRNLHQVDKDEKKKKIGARHGERKRGLTQFLRRREGISISYEIINWLMVPMVH